MCEEEYMYILQTVVDLNVLCTTFALKYFSTVMLHIDQLALCYVESWASLILLLCMRYLFFVEKHSAY